MSLVSPRPLNAKRDLPVMAWTVRWVLSVRVPKNDNNSTPSYSHVTLQKRIGDSGKTFLLYRMQMLRLLAYPKPLNAQLAIELPCLMGFRTAEVASWRAEYLDFQNMNCQVMDSKKHTLFTVPLSREVAKHTEQLLEGRTEGPVITSTGNRNRGKQVVPMTIWHIWNRWTKRARLPNARDISPIAGRRLFAGLWCHLFGLSLITLSKIMRHADPGVTLLYVGKLVFYEDLKADFHKFERSLAEDLRGQWLVAKEAQ